ncbi:hypothetical protein [Streptomyces sp. AVP053U2]|uniref:hypothetical protein n=1 Tax=Streptomyces sp. AVP053U2 TaxID=1737066 RepID=UPI00073B94CD|nr:hypothetical protein [Streptomyces sp. AVP053U2]ODA75534.1 hypothetical protein APS67_000096 [Streptomyces sp. AVP053U2]
MLARPLLTITIAPNPASLPLLGSLVASLPLWVPVPETAAWATGFLVAFRVRARLTRRTTRV